MNFQVFQADQNFGTLFCALSVCNFTLVGIGLNFQDGNREAGICLLNYVFFVDFTGR
jgi:hypothetical protein